MSWKLANFMDSRLSQAIAAAATTIYIDADDVDLLPTLGASDKAKAVIFNATDREIVNITAWTTDGTLTVERAKEGTTAVAFAAGTKIVHTPTAEILQAVLDATIQAVYRGTATGTDAITVTTTGSVPTPSDGDEVTFEVANTNTAGVTLAVTNGSSTIGPFSVVKQDGAALRAGELRAGWRAKVLYDSTAAGWTLISQASKRYDIDRINTGPLTAGNQLPNGSFDAWNNATTFATPASGTETADNVVAEYDGTIGAFSVSRQTFTLGQTDVDGGPKYYLRWDQSSAGAASTYRRLRMRIPQVGKYALELVIASLYAKADIGRNVTARLIQSFGTGGAPSAEVVLVSEVWALTTGWQRFDLSTTVTSIAGKTLGSGGDDGLILELSLPVNTSMTIDFAMGQFELGDAMTKPHSRLPWPWQAGGTGGSFDSATDFINTVFPDAGAIEALAGTSGLLAKTAANAWALRNLAVGTGLVVTNPAGIAGDPTVGLGTALTDYVADPMSVAELASITGTFGTAAFLPDSNIVHIAGNETITGIKRVEQAVATDLLRFGNTANTSLVAPRWTDATTFEFVPAPSATPDATKGFGYDVTNTRWFCDTAFLSSGVVTVPDGSAANPGLKITSEQTGLYRVSATALGVAVAGGGVAIFSTTAANFSAIAQIIGSSGSAATPTIIVRASDTNSGRYSIADDNIGEATGGALRFDWNTSRLLFASSFDVQLNSATIPASVTSVGFRGVPNIAGDKSAGYSTAGSDCGAAIPFTASATLTISTNASIPVPIGTVIMVPSLNGGGNVTVHPDTGVTLRRGDGTAGTGDRTVAANSAAWLWKRGTDEWYIFGLFT